MEKEVSGLYLSGHPLDAYRAQIAQVSTCTIAQLLGEDAKQFDNQTVTLVCTIVKNKIMTTKSNTLMAFTTVEDLTGSMELLVFPRILAECRAALQENAVVVANGRVSVKEDEAARLIVEGVQPIETYDPGKNFGMNRVERVKRETDRHIRARRQQRRVFPDRALPRQCADAQGRKPALQHFRRGHGAGVFPLPRYRQGHAGAAHGGKG